MKNVKVKEHGLLVVAIAMVEVQSIAIIVMVQEKKSVLIAKASNNTAITVKTDVFFAVTVMGLAILK